MFLFVKPTKASHKLLASLALFMLTSVVSTSSFSKPDSNSLKALSVTTRGGFAKQHPLHKHCQTYGEDKSGFIRCFLDHKTVEGIKDWRLEFLFFNDFLVELQLSHPTDTPATYDSLKDRLSKLLWQPVASEINDPALNVRDAKIMRGTETASWTYRETTWKQELANKKHRQTVLNESIEFPRGGEKSTKPTGVSIRVKNY